MPNSTHADHAHHELTLIAGHAAGDLSDTDRAAADVLLAACNSCVELRRDLVAIATATRSLPAQSLPARDFRLDPERAARLRRGSWVRAALRPFASTSSAVRPMAAAFTTLGIAGVFVATVLPGIVGMAGSPALAPGSLDRDVTSVEAAGPSSAPAAPGSPGAGAGQGAVSTLNPAGYNQQSAPPGRTSTDGKADDVATAAPQVAVGNVDSTGGDAGSGNEAVEPTTLASPSINPILAGSLALLGVGLLLFGLRFAGRRLR